MISPNLPRRGVARAALTVSAGSVASRLLGLLRELVIAGLYGRNAATDAFTAASRVPTTLYDLLVGGMISAALVPVLSAEAERDEADFWRLAGALGAAFLLLLSAVAVGVALAAPLLISLIAPDFRPETQDLASILLRIMAPSLVFLGLSGLATAVLQSRRQFLAPAFGAAAFNLGLVGVALVLRDRGAEALAFGLLAGAAAQLALQLLGLRGNLLRPALSLSHPALRRIGGLYLPVFIGLVISTIGVAFDTNLASRLPAGDLSALRYATTLSQFALGVVATAVGSAYLPELARVAGVDRSAYAAVLGQALRAVLALIVPVALALFLFREPLLRLIFERGAFGPEDTARTALAFAAYAPGIPAFAIDQILIYSFYARQDTTRPVIVGILSVLVYLVCALLLIDPLGLVGLALANSAQWGSHAVVMASLVAISERPLSLGNIVSPALRVIVAALPAGIVWWIAAPYLSFATGPLLQAVVLGAVGIAGLGLYVVSLLALGDQDIRSILQRLRRGLPGQRP